MSAPPHAKLVELWDIVLEYRGKPILNGVTLTVYEEEVLVILGLSGGGKSTLLSILNAVRRPKSGSICLRGKNEELSEVSRARLTEIRTRIGMVQQNAALISSMTVGDNIALPLREHTLKSEEEISEIISQKLRLVGLEDARDKLPSELSGGMQKRASLARALALEPLLVLFDEPSAGLDPINSRNIDNLIKNLRDEHKTASIVVTHELDSAFSIASRMAFLHEGKIIFEGTPDEIKRSEIPIIRNFLSDT